MVGLNYGLIAQTSPEFRSNCTYMELLPIITQTSPAVSGQRLNLTIDSLYCRKCPKCPYLFLKGLIAQTYLNIRHNYTHMELLPIITQTSLAVSGQRLNFTIDSLIHLKSLKCP